MIRSIVAISVFISVSSIVTPVCADETLRYISIPGGGGAAVAPIMWLKKIESKTGQKMRTLVDGVVGNSAGSVLAASICSRKSANHSPVFDADDAQETFIRNVQNFSFFHADAAMDSMLKDTFGDAMLSQSLCHLMTFAYHRPGETILHFDSSMAHQKNQDFPVWQAVRASSSIDWPFLGPLTSFTAVAQSGARLEGLSDPALHGHNDPTPFLVQRIKELYPERRAVIYSLGTGGDLPGLQQDGNITIVRIEPDFRMVNQAWSAYLRSFLPISIFPKTAKIMDVLMAAQDATQSTEFRMMIADFAELARRNS